MADSGGGTPVDFFISYTKADENWAEWIWSELVQAGQVVVAQFNDFGPGADWFKEMDKALMGARRVIGVLSPAYLESDYATAEWQAVLRDDPEGTQRRFVPVMVVRCRPRGMAGAPTRIDLVGVDEGEARRRLFAGLGLPVPERDPSKAGAHRPVPFPGGLPTTGWRVPHHINRNFVDRDGLVDELHRLLSADQAVHCAVVGMGGVGKTQVAASYALRYGNQYDGVWWVSAADMSSVRRDYAALAAQLGVEERRSDDPDDLIAAVQTRIERDGKRWLLIFDDSFDSATSLDLIPKENVKVIVTSRNGLWWEQGPPVLEVDVFSEEVAVSFLLKRSGKKDATAARQLSNELGRLPLALEQAGAYVARSAVVDLARYLREFRSRAAVMLSQSDNPELRSVAATFQPSFQHLEKTAAEATALLRLLAFLAPDDIPLSLLLKANRAAPDMLGALPGDLFTLGPAISRLNEYSLVRGRDIESVGVHQMVQAVLRAHLGDDARRWAEAAVQILVDDFPEDSGNRATWSYCARLYPHVVAATTYTLEEGAPPDATIELLTRAGTYLRRRYEFADARDVLVRASELADSTYGPALTTLADTLYQTARVFSNQRNLREARRHLERALLVGKAAQGDDSERVGRLQEELAFEVLRWQGELPEAKALLERAIQIYEQKRGRNHPSVAFACTKLGFVLWDMQEDFGKARAAFLRARRIFEAAEGYGPEHKEVARVLTGLGQVAVDQGKFALAERRQKEAIKIFKARLGERDLEVARTMDKLGYVKREQGAFDKAIELHLAALDIFRSVFNDDNHPEVAFVFTNLGLAFRDMGQFAEAHKHHSDALRIFERFEDTRHCGIVRGRLDEVRPPTVIPPPPGPGAEAGR